MTDETLRELGRILLCSIEANSECPQSAQRQVGLERAGDAAVDTPPLLERGGERRIGADDGAKQEVAVAADELRRAVHNRRCPEREWLLPKRGREGVIDRDGHTSRSCSVD